MKRMSPTFGDSRKLGIGFLVFCFGLSNVNTALATEVVNSSPIIVQPYDLRDISDQMLAQDRVNRDQELAIRGLIDDNQKLTDTALARQQDATLEKINQTLIKYRDYLITRDKLRITANGERISKYHDLIKLTEDVDNSRDGRVMQLKSDVIEEKYKILTELKDEMIALNEKLKSGVAVQENTVRENTVPENMVHENIVKTSPEQNDKIQMLTQRLAEMDQRIAHFDEILAEKDREIAQLKSKVKQQDVDLKTKDESIRWLNQVLAAAKSKAEYYQLTSQENKSSHQQVDLLKSELENKIVEGRSDDRLKLARHLINLQQQAISLLEEKYRLRLAHNTLADQHIVELENKIKVLLANRQTQDADSRGRMEDLKNELSQTQQQVGTLKAALTSKIEEEKNQNVLAEEIQDLKVQLQDKENQINNLKATIQSGQATEAQTEDMKQQLADQQNKMDLLKQELDNKTAQSEQMTAMMSGYQKKLESKDDAYNQELKQVMSAKNDQSLQEEQMDRLNARLQEKEAQIVKIKKDLYDLQELNRNKERDIQSKDLSQSMVQQKTSDAQAQEIKGLRTELALARQELKGMPSTDEIDFMKTGFKNATLQLKQKDAMLAQIKANAEEYQREFKAQSLEFKSLKEQLQSANDEINRRNEDLKYKQLELTRFKEITAVKEGDLLDQVRALTRKLKGHGGIIMPAKNDTVGQKLKQALDKIDEQGRIINVLVKKLQDAGQTVNLTQQ